MCLVMILVKKVFIFSKTMIICLLCPLLCGLFFFWKGAKGELSYKSTEKRLKARLYLSLLVYTVVGYGLTLILDYIFSKFDIGKMCIRDSIYPVDAEDLIRIPVYSESPKCYDSQAFFGIHDSSLHSQSHCFRHSQNTRSRNR